MTAGSRATWRGEVVRVIKIAGDKATIARPGVGLRTVKLSELEVAHAQ
jgi:hypothetical protein